MDLCNINVIKSIMADAGITFHKEFGQNFLTNRIIPEDIADNCAATSERMILEIGPGIGAMTRELSDLFTKITPHLLTPHFRRKCKLFLQALPNSDACKFC